MKTPSRTRSGATLVAALLCLPPVLALAWGLELRLQPRAVAWLERLRKGRRGDLVSAPR